jgi:predicted nucleic acid-binding protein
LKILFDTNVLLDVLLDREPFSTTAALLFSKVEKGELSGYLCATTITTLHYLASKVLGAHKARQHISDLLNLFEVAAVNRPVLDKALKSKLPDFEDAVICEAARNAGVHGLVTRDMQGFKRAKITVYSPEELAGIIEQREDTSQ